MGAARSENAFIFFKTVPKERFQSVPVPIFIEKLDLGTILDFQDFPRKYISDNVLGPKSSNKHLAFPTGPFLAAALIFPKTIVITVSLNRVVFKDKLSMEIGSF